MKIHKRLVFSKRCLLLGLVILMFLIAGCSQSTPANGNPSPDAGSGMGQDQPRVTEMVSGTLSVPGELDPQTTLAPENNTCPKLDSLLNQIAQASDPLSAARELNLKLKDDKVQVVIVLSGEQTDFLPAFDVEVGSQAGNEVQVFAPPARLCELSNREEVLAIRVPAEGLILP